MCALIRSSTSILPGIWSQFLHQLWIFLNSLSRFFWPQQHTECHPPSILENILESLNINNNCSPLNPEINCSKKNLSITSHLCSFALKLQKLSNSACIPGIVFCFFFSSSLCTALIPRLWMENKNLLLMSATAGTKKKKHLRWQGGGIWGGGGSIPGIVFCCFFPAPYVLL